MSVMGTYDLRCLLGDLILFCLGMNFLEWCAWGCGFQGLVCLGTSILAPLLLGDLLGVDLLGSVRQGCREKSILEYSLKFCDRVHSNRKISS